MTIRCSLFLILAAILPAASISPAADRPRPVVATHDVSFQNEIQHAIDRGLDWLKANQNAGGWWSTADQPAVTALALMAMQADPNGRLRGSEALQRGYKFVLASVRPDGGIYRTNTPTYNTSISMMALLAARNPDWDSIVLKARQFLVNLQGDFGEKGKIDSPFDGGIGYGSRYEHSDMGNTVHALEAIYYSKRLLEDKKSTSASELNWDALKNFLQNCQNLPTVNKESWVAGDAQNKGGFVYYPGNSMAGSVTNAQGRVALRSYGSISYAGLLSYIYADLKKDDQRVQAVFDWLRKNYTLEENPGMGPQGLYYYMHTMTKALNAYGAGTLTLENGKMVNWRRDVSERLLNLQRTDGSWFNDNNRWWEKDPALITSYAVISLSTLYRAL